MTETAVQEWLDSKKWTFAKTMAQIPHEWVCKWNMPKSEYSTFQEVVAWIQENGQPEQFYSKIYKYYYYNGHKYWTMGAPPVETYIINRARP